VNAEFVHRKVSPATRESSAVRFMKVLLIDEGFGGIPKRLC